MYNCQMMSCLCIVAVTKSWGKVDNPRQKELIVIENIILKMKSLKQGNEQPKCKKGPYKQQHSVTEDLCSAH